MYEKLLARNSQKYIMHKEKTIGAEDVINNENYKKNLTRISTTILIIMA